MTRAAALLCLTLGASVTVQPSRAESSPIQLFDCHLGFKTWETSWSADWKEWCCEKEGRGCPTTTVQPYYWMGPYQTDIPGIGLGGIIVSALEECQQRCYMSPICKAIQYSGSEKYQGSNCFQFASTDDTGEQYHTFQIYKLFRETSTVTTTSATTSSATTATLTTTTNTFTTKTSHTTTTTKTVFTTTSTASTMTTLGCATNCTAGGSSGTCDERIAWTMAHDVDLLNKANAWGAEDFQAKLCHAAGEIVQSECAECDVCSVKHWCHQLTTVTTTPMLGCKTDCEFNGNRGTCEERMRWSMAHDAQVEMSNNSCEAAGEMVVSQCPNCGVVCDIKPWCTKEELANSFFKKKFEVVGPLGFFGSTGSSKFMSASLIMVSAVAGTIVALAAYRSRAGRGVVQLHQYVDSYAHPLCPMSDGQLSSESA